MPLAEAELRPRKPLFHLKTADVILAEDPAHEVGLVDAQVAADAHDGEVLLEEP